MQRVAAVVAAGVLALVAPAAACAYGWPVKPFDRPHPIRGAFDDPREHEDAIRTLQSFHFGVDICAPDETPVYAVASGTAYVQPDYVSVKGPEREFSYWHIRAAVAEYSFVHEHELVGWVKPGWGHVHFAERAAGIYLNPLRPKGLAPFVDDTAPTVAALTVFQGTRAVDPSRVSGIVDVVADAYDTPPLPPPGLWHDARWTPALVRWRLLHDGRPVIDWQVAADFRLTLLPDWLYQRVYAPGTRQNHPGRPGRFLFRLAQDLDTTTLPNGVYRLEVDAEDTRGNTGFAATDLTIANLPRRPR